MREVVTTDPGMGIEQEKRLVFFPQRQHQADEQSVLEDIGKIPGVKQVSVGQHGQ